LPGCGNIVCVDALLPWRFVRVTGSSMTPTLVPGDVVLAQYGRTVRPATVVLARFRALPDQAVLKRAVRPEAGGWWLHSDNARAGSDSRQYGVADVEAPVVLVWRVGPARPRRDHGLAARVLQSVTRYCPHRVPAVFPPDL